MVVLFILLPIVAAVIIVPILVWWLSKGPRPMLTSELLAQGIPAEGRIVRIRSLGSMFDARPMLRVSLQVTEASSGEPFDLDVVQSFPRSMVGVFRPGDIVNVRLSEDHSMGAIEWGYEVPPEA